MTNPWAERFAELRDRGKLRRLTERMPKPLKRLEVLDIETACTQLNLSLAALFIPTEQILSIFDEVIGQAIAYSQHVYPNRRKFIKEIYAKPSTQIRQSEIPQFPARCLTGLSGTGKTELMLRLREIMTTCNGKISVDKWHSSFPLMSVWHLLVQEKLSKKTMIEALLCQAQNTEEGTSRVIPSDRLNFARRTAFTCGVAQLLADEFQFITRSDRANALATSLLSYLMLIGPPLTYAANFSLLHRLLRRSQEDIQRLLSHITVLWPDMPDSDDWKATLVASRDVAPEIFKFCPHKDARDIYQWTAGIKRVLRILLVLAYRGRKSRQFVSTEDIAAAYQSPSFTAIRRDVELIHVQNITGKMERGRHDLWCPIELPKTHAKDVKETTAEHRLVEMAKAIVMANLTKAERDSLAALRQQGALKPSNRTKRPGRTDVTKEELLKGEAWLRDELRKTRGIA